jgi:hypothetical protein
MILRKRVTGVSFLRDPHYVSFHNFSARLTRSVRRASGLVLVGNPEVAISDKFRMVATLQKLN